jgi:hypothetical protein
MIHHEQEFVKAAYHRLLKLGDSSFQSKSSERSYKTVESMPNEELVRAKEDNIAFLKEYLRVVQFNTTSVTVQITVLKEVNELTEGASFGELALLLDKPRTATIFTKTP